MIITSGNRIVRTTGVAAEALRPGKRREEDDRVAAELNVELQVGLLLVGQLGLARIELEGFQDREIDGEFFGGHRRRIIAGRRRAIKR